MVQIAELHAGEFGEVGDALDRRQAGAALEPGREDLGQQLRARARRDLRRREQRRLAQRAASEQQRGPAAAAQRAGDGLDPRGVDRLRRRRRRWRAGHAAVAPRHVGRQDQRRDLAGRSDRGGDRVDRVAREVRGPLRGADEAG
jgi:hypothetical protein